MPPTTGAFLNMLVKIAGARNVLEIGTSNGYSGIWLAEALSHSGGCLYTVESNKERFELARKNFKRAGLDTSIKQILGHAPEIFPQIDQRFELMFVDATKMEYKSYVEGLLPMLKSGGLIVADNAISHVDELVDFFEFLNKQKNLQNLLMPVDNGLMMTLSRPLLKAGNR